MRKPNFYICAPGIRELHLTCSLAIFMLLQGSRSELWDLQGVPVMRLINLMTQFSYL